MARKATASHSPSPQLPRGGDNDQRCRKLPASAGRQSRARAWSRLQRFFPFPTPAWHLRPTRPVQSVRFGAGVAPRRAASLSQHPAKKTKQLRDAGYPDGAAAPPRRLGRACGDEDGGRSAGKQQKGQRQDHREPRPPGGATPTALTSLRVLCAPAAETVRYADSLADGGSNGLSTPLRGSCGKSLFALSF